MAKAPQKRKTSKRPPLPTVEVEIDRLNEDGLGVGRHEGKEILVAGVLPGERVAAAIEHEGQRRLVGRLRRVLHRSSQRVASPCAHADACQGCSLIAMDYRAQLDFKRQKVRAAFGEYRSLQGVEIAPVWAAENPFGYRSNAKLVLSKVRGRVKAGLYRRGSHEVVDIGDCPLHHPLINRIVAVVREEIERQEVFIYDPVKRRGLLRYLTVKVSPTAEKAMVTFVTAERDYRRITHLAKWLKKKVPEVVSVQQNVNASSGNVIFGRETLRMLGSPDLIDSVGEIRLRISPTAFFQVNNAQAARIYALVRQWAALSPQECALDLYCGIGGISLNLARDAGKVIGIEAVEEAVRNARENARLNDIRGCTFRAGDAAELLQELALEIPPQSVAVLNPPRGGCDREVLEATARLQPRMVIYVSCNPQTLARDLDVLAGLGYSPQEVQPVDMFPQTPHVETVVRMAPARN